MWPRFQVRIKPLPCRKLPWLGVSITSDSCVGIPVSGWSCLWCCLCIYPSWGFQWWWLQGICWRHVWPWRVYWVSKIFRQWGLILMTAHFVGLKLICHLSSDVRFSRRRCLSWSFWITLKTALTLANNFDEDDLMTSARPLMKSATRNLLSNYMTTV